TMPQPSGGRQMETEISPMEGIVILGSLSTNRDPNKRTQVFEPTPNAYTSLEEGIQAAKDHYWTNINRGTVPRFRVYESSDPDGTTYALMEVSEGSGDMVFVALYKIIAGKYRWRREPGTETQSHEGENAVADPTSMSIPASLPHGFGIQS